MDPTAELLLLSIRKQTLENEIERFYNRVNRNRVELYRLQQRAAVLNEELKEQQNEIYKYEKI